MLGLILAIGIGSGFRIFWVLDFGVKDLCFKTYGLLFNISV